MVETILGIVLEISKIVDKDSPGFAAKMQEKVDSLRSMYNEEIGKGIDTIDAARADSIESSLRDCLQLLRTAVSGSQNPSQPSKTVSSSVSS